MTIRLRYHALPVEQKCQACKQDVWKACIASPRGKMYLCADCADNGVHDRDHADKNPSAASAFARLVRKVFGG